MTDQVMQKDPTNPPNLRLTVAGNKPITGELRNNGYAPTFFIGEELTVKLAGGLLQENYFLKQFHFHFGCNDTVGSEHTVDGNTYPIEVISNVQSHRVSTLVEEKYCKATSQQRHSETLKPITIISKHLAKWPGVIVFPTYAVGYHNKRMVTNIWRDQTRIVKSAFFSKKSLILNSF